MIPRAAYKVRLLYHKGFPLRHYDETKTDKENTVHSVYGLDIRFFSYDLVSIQGEQLILFAFGADVA